MMGELPISYFFPLYSTGLNGLPVATSARPSVHSKISCGWASWRRVGLLSGRTIGRSAYLAISRMISSEKALGLVDVPMRTCGLTCCTTEKRSRSWSSGHSESSLAKLIWRWVSLSPRDLTRRPGLSRHLDRGISLGGTGGNIEEHVPYLL